MRTKESLVGKVFGRLTVLERDYNRKNNKEPSRWLCVCKCGTKKSILRSSLVKGLTYSCGCLKAEKAVENSKKGIGIAKSIKDDLTGKTFGKLTILHRDLSKICKERGSFWVCKCECGKIHTTSRHSIVTRGTKSCGCLTKERAAQRAMPNGQADKNHWINKYKRRSKELKIEFTLTDEEFHDICSLNCFYCNAVPTKKSNGHTNLIDKGSYMANGIDRVNPNIGYTKENSVACCKTCNFMKTDKTQEEFIEKIIQIANNIRRNNVLS